MKTKALISILIFVGMFSFINSHSPVGIDRIPLDSLEWGAERVLITFYMVLLPSAFIAAIPFTTEILKKILGRRWEQ